LREVNHVSRRRTAAIPSIRIAARQATSIAFSRGEKPGDLPVQAPAKYQLIVNLKTARRWA
jgi:hypothetical protein